MRGRAIVHFASGQLHAGASGLRLNDGSGIKFSVKLAVA